MGAVREVVLKQAATADRIARGHPWVWREAIARGLDGAVAGEEVQIVGADGAPVGRGLVDPDSPIAVRVWTRKRDPIDPALWRARATRACLLRERLLGGTRTDAFRVLHGEGDRMPGVVVDRYGPVAVARTDGDAAATRTAWLADAVWPSLEAWGVRTLVLRAGGKGQTPRIEVLRGAAPPDTVTVEEHGVPFVVDLARGQKTGAFLDQRDNRRRVGELARGRRVLNLFSYAGGFSLHAALGGASHVTSVDIAAGAHATAQASFHAAGVDPRAHAFVTADVQTFLDGARSRRQGGAGAPRPADTPKGQDLRSGQRPADTPKGQDLRSGQRPADTPKGQEWDLIISDPPSYAPSEKTLPRALTAYRTLHAACAAVLAPGGIFCASSCSSHVDATTFLSTLDDAVLGDRNLAVLELHGAGIDHPTLPAFPEGRYLKFAVLG
jgi:23S rRNA (cytosine1962-C5)-methyltransferase